MKAKHISFIVGAIMLMILGFYAYSFCEQKKANNTNAEIDSLPAEELFVPIQADTLDQYLKRYFNRGDLKTKKSRNQYTVEYNQNAFILLHANNNKMEEARKTLESAKVEDFSISYKDKKVKIVMREHDGYVDCPALIVAEILRKMNEQ